MFSGIVEALGTVVGAPPGAARLPADRPRAENRRRNPGGRQHLGQRLLPDGDRQPGRHVRLSGRPGNARPHQSRRTEARQPGESGTGAGRRRSAGRAFRQRAHRRRGHAVEREDCGDWSTFWFSVPAELAVQMASKGSIAVDGVSLTIVDSEPDRFSVALIPYTLAVTTLGRLQSAAG